MDTIVRCLPQAAPGSRPAAVGDKLVTQSFGTGTRGFAACDDPAVAVCLTPGTEIAFTDNISVLPYGLLGSDSRTISHRTAIFRQINKDNLAAHHDAVEFPDGADRVADDAVRRSDGNGTPASSLANERGRGSRARAGRICWLISARPCRLSALSGQPRDDLATLFVVVRSIRLLPQPMAASCNSRSRCD